MLFYLFFFLAGCFCHSSNDIRKKTAMLNTMAALPCPHKGDVTWSRFIKGALVNLVTIKNGVEKMTDKRYGSLADNSLVIRNVVPSDSAMYFCNKAQVYLEVTTDPNVAVPNSGDVSVAPRNDGLNLVPGQEGTEKQTPSDFWKVPVGVVAGAVLVLLAIFTLRFCSKKRTERNGNVVETATERIYEEIDAGGEPLRRDTYLESTYYWTSVSETPSTSTPSLNNLTVNKLTAEGGSSEEEYVYSFIQNPPQTGNVNE